MFDTNAFDSADGRRNTPSASAAAGMSIAKAITAHKALRKSFFILFHPP